MNMDEQLHSSSDAWQRAWRVRCCPPEHFLKEEAHTEAVYRHLEVCPWCCQVMAIDLEDSGIDFSSVSVDGPVSPPLPGELRAVRASLGGWGEKARYYAPPIVLVLAVMENNMAQVMQVYDDSAMASDDDIGLGPDFDGFAETWNRYSLKKSDLSFSYGSVPPHVLETCLNFAADTGMTIEPGSLLWFFRNMEVETGFFFARQAVRLSMADMCGWPVDVASLENGAGTPDPPIVSLSTVHEQLKKLGLQYRSSDMTGMTLADVLVRTQIANDQLPLAASGGKEELSALVFTSKDGIICDYNVFPFVLNHLELQGTTLLVSGFFTESKPVFDDFFCRIKSEEKLLSPLPGSFGSQDGIFWAAFSVKNTREPPKKSELILRCIRYR